MFDSLEVPIVGTLHLNVSTGLIAAWATALQIEILATDIMSNCFSALREVKQRRSLMQAHHSVRSVMARMAHSRANLTLTDALTVTSPGATGTLANSARASIIDARSMGGGWMEAPSRRSSSMRPMLLPAADARV